MASSQSLYSFLTAEASRSSGEFEPPAAERSGYAPSLVAPPISPIRAMMGGVDEHIGDIAAIVEFQVYRTATIEIFARKGSKVRQAQLSRESAVVAQHLLRWKR